MTALSKRRETLQRELAQLDEQLRQAQGKQRDLILALRQARRIELGGIERYLGAERSIPPKHRKVLT